MNGRTVRVILVFATVLVFLVVPARAERPLPPAAGIHSEWPTDAQSTTGPVPPSGIERGELGVPSAMAEVVLLDVPAYLWHNGCGPTAAGMVIGYWDGNGFDNLVSGSADTQTPEVDAMISSSGNYDDYCLPIDSPPNLLEDKSEPPVGDEHPDDCVADLMKTSQSFHHNYYGWSWYSHVDDALQGYVQMVAPGYSPIAENRTWGAFTWSSYRAEIDDGRPVVLLVDTNGDGGTDHFVTAIGYSDESATNMYACRNTWDTDVHWFEFAEMAGGQPWGIYGATLFQLSNAPPTIAGLPDQLFDHTSSPPSAIDLWAYASDAETPVDGLTYTIEGTPPAGAGVTLSGTHDVIVNPSPNWCGGTDVTVRATDPGGLWDEDAFRVAVSWSCPGPVEMPGAPVLIAPVDGRTASGSPVFAWHEVGGVEGYRVQVDNGAGFSGPERDATTTSTEFVLSSGLGRGTYHWRVQAVSGSEVGDWSEGWSFAVLAPSPAELKIYLPIAIRNYPELVR